MTLMKTIFWSLSRQTVFLQNLFNHIRLLFLAFVILLTTLFQKNFTFACLFNFYWISPNKKVRFAQVLAFSKIAEIEGEVFIALRASQGDLQPSRATFSPQSPCSLTPDLALRLWNLFHAQLSWAWNFLSADKSQITDNCKFFLAKHS